MSRTSPQTTFSPSSLRHIAITLTLALATSALAADRCPYMCGDFTGDGLIDINDYDAFELCMGTAPDASQTCFCADMNGSGEIDLGDFAHFAGVFAHVADELPPDCTGTTGSTADLTAYRPQHGTGYAPFARTAIPEAYEEDAQFGPGIRINAPGDADPNGEDDLIEVSLTVDPPGAALALFRSNPALAVWTTRDKQAGTDIPFLGDKTATLPLGPAQTQMTLWVEWAAPTPGIAALSIEPPAADLPKDTLVFHTFHSIVMALGGEDQTPSSPPDPNSGTFVVAVALYSMGYDVHMYDEDNVAADGTGAVFNEVATAVQTRGVDEVAIFGYSHGGGSTYSLADLLDQSRAALGYFEITFTSYVDSVRNNSDIDIAQELRRPPSTAYHVNHYQHGSFFEDLGLDGGPVDNSNPPPTGLDVETTTWGATATHFEVDDYVQVRDLIVASLDPLVTRDQGFTRRLTGDTQHKTTLPRSKGAGEGFENRADSPCASTAPSTTITTTALFENPNALQRTTNKAQTMPQFARSITIARLCTPLILFTFPGAAPAAFADQSAVITPDAAMQASIADVAHANTASRRKQAFETLSAWKDANQDELIRQLIYYSSNATTTQDAMAAGAILKQLEISNDAITNAILPLLDSTNAKLRANVENILGGFEGRAAGRRPDYSTYRALLENCVRAGEEPPNGLIRHMYTTDPGEALLTLMRAYQLRDPAELKEILWAEHVVADVLWKQRNGFLKPDESETAANHELAKLARHPDWWARLYAAEIMHQHKTFRQRALLEALKADNHPLVRDAVANIAPEQ